MKLNFMNGPALVITAIGASLLERQQMAESDLSLINGALRRYELLTCPDDLVTDVDLENKAKEIFDGQTGFGVRLFNLLQKASDKFYDNLFLEDKENDADVLARLQSEIGFSILAKYRPFSELFRSPNTISVKSLRQLYLGENLHRLKGIGPKSIKLVKAIVDDYEDSLNDSGSLL